MRVSRWVGRSVTAFAVSTLLLVGVPGVQNVPIVGPSVSTPEAEAAGTRYINCFDQRTPGIYKGMKGSWVKRRCFDTWSGCWITLYTWFSPGNTY